MTKWSGNESFLFPTLESIFVKPDIKKKMVVSLIFGTIMNSR